ncbi:hypothetical protein C0J29_07835 [Mycobacterium paragordonae]|nr:hypothetical protein C0J29_07835 [Mycobacterium paragordonae]
MSHACAAPNRGSAPAPPNIWAELISGGNTRKLIASNLPSPSTFGMRLAARPHRASTGFRARRAG